MSEPDTIKMLNFLIVNIFDTLIGYVFQQSIGIPIGTNCAPLLAYFNHMRIRNCMKKENKLAVSFDSTFRFIFNILSLNNSKFVEHVERIHSIEFEQIQQLQ